MILFRTEPKYPRHQHQVTHATGCNANKSPNIKNQREHEEFNNQILFYQLKGRNK